MYPQIPSLTNQSSTLKSKCSEEERPIKKNKEEDGNLVHHSAAVYSPVIYDNKVGWCFLQMYTVRVLHLNSHIHTFMHAHTHACMHEHTHARANTHTHAYTTTILSDRTTKISWEEVEIWSKRWAELWHQVSSAYLLRAARPSQEHAQLKQKLLV